MGIVGANQWEGGYQRYTSTGQKPISYEPSNMEPDSYLGTNITVHKVNAMVYLHCCTVILPPIF